MKKKRAKAKGNDKNKGFDHHCFWRKAAIKLASCVAATLQTDGKIGMGSGMVMRVRNGKKSLERWDKDFVEALAFIGIEVTDAKDDAKKQPGAAKKTGRRSNTVGIECEHGYDACPTCDAPRSKARAA